MGKYQEIIDQCDLVNGETKVLMLKVGTMMKENLELMKENKKLKREKKKLQERIKEFSKR